MQLVIPHRAGVRFVVLFVTVFSLLQVALIRSEQSWLARLLIDDVTVGVSAALIDHVYPQDNAFALARSIVSQRVRLNVLHGCEGTEAMFLLIAAILAFSAPWRSRVKALGTGCLLVYVLNELRILALYATARDARYYFELMHGYVGPTIVIVAIVLFFTAWVARQATPVRQAT